LKTSLSEGVSFCEGFQPRLTLFSMLMTDGVQIGGPVACADAPQIL